ncbi:MAG: PTS sugar transporter subunit IIA [Erysipelotrichaceae bacterium]
MTSLFNPKLMVLDLEASTVTEVLTRLSNRLIAEGYVKESFTQAILERETEFSTGLPGLGRGVAIPHADPEHVNASVIAVGILRNPVQFKMMGNHDETIEVEVVFMLALKESHSHMSVLQSLMDVIQNESLLKQIKEAATQDTLLQLMSANIA